MRLLTALARSGWCLKLGCLLLAGCADSDLGPIVVKSVEYHRAEPREFEMPDGRYRVYDKPEKG